MRVGQCASNAVGSYIYIGKGCAIYENILAKPYLVLNFLLSWETRMINGIVLGFYNRGG